MRKFKDNPPSPKRIAGLDSVIAVNAHSIETIVNSTIQTQFAFARLCSDLTLAWASLPASLVAVESPANATQETTPEGAGSDKAARQTAAPVSVASTVSGAAMFAPIVIDGIEEILNDQTFEPRPAEAEANDISKLWERSNEFGQRVTPGASARRRTAAGRSKAA